MQVLRVAMEVNGTGADRFRAIWTDSDGLEQSTITTSRAEAVKVLARRAHGGLRFHDLRPYATWLISNGVPFNYVKTVMGPRAGIHDPQSIHARLRMAGRPGSERVC